MLVISILTDNFIIRMIYSCPSFPTVRKNWEACFLLFACLFLE